MQQKAIRRVTARSLGALALLLVLGTSAPAATGAEAIVRVDRPHYDSVRHSLVFDISGPVTISTRSLKAPVRLVVDVPGATLMAPNRDLRVEDGLVRRVRLSQFQILPPIVRVVIEPATEAEPLIAVQQTPDKLYITLAPARSQSDGAEDGDDSEPEPAGHSHPGHAHPAPSAAPTARPASPRPAAKAPSAAPTSAPLHGSPKGPASAPTPSPTPRPSSTASVQPTGPSTTNGPSSSRASTPTPGPSPKPRPTTEPQATPAPAKPVGVTPVSTPRPATPAKPSAVAQPSPAPDDMRKLSSPAPARPAQVATPRPAPTALPTPQPSAKPAADKPSGGETARETWPGAN